MTKISTKETIKTLLIQLGVKSGQTILDFGCGNGNYTLPTAKIVGENGLVIAIDESIQSLTNINREAQQGHINNIITLLPEEKDRNLTKINEIDIILAFDVLHFLERHERKDLYLQFYQKLSSNGLFVIHPKHTKNNEPMGHLSTITVGGLIEEIQQQSFQLINQQTLTLVHDSRIEKGPVLVFIKKVIY